MKLLEYVNGLARELTKEEKAEALDKLRVLFVEEMDRIFPSWNDEYAYTKTGSLGADAPGEALVLDEEYKKAQGLIKNIEVISDAAVSDRKKAEAYEKESKGLLKYDFGKVIDTLCDVYKSVSDAMLAEKESFDTKYAADRATGNYSDQHFAELTKAHEERMAELSASLLEAQEESRKLLAESTRAFYAIEPKLIDDDVLKLINSGVILEEGDIKALELRYKSNPTMLRVLYSNADKKLSTQFKHNISGKDEMEILNGFISFTKAISSHSASVRSTVLGQLESAAVKYKAKFLELPYRPISL